jgi:hypothetical protein
MTEQLSSDATFVYKYVFPTFWIGLFGLGTLLALVGPTNNAANHAMGIPLALVWIVGSRFTLSICGALKRVHLDGDDLIVSNYIRQIAVPVGDIEDVRQNIGTKLRSITMQFRHDTPFGRRIVFMPKVSFRLFSEDKIVQRLRDLAGLH